MTLLELLKEAKERHKDALNAWSETESNAEKLTEQEYTELNRAAVERIRTTGDEVSVLETALERLLEKLAADQGEPAPQNWRERYAWLAEMEASEYDVELPRLPTPPEVSKYRLDEFEKMAKELSAAESHQWVEAAAMTLGKLDEQLRTGEITPEQYTKGRDFALNIAIEASQTYNRLVGELAHDYLQEQEDDWDKPIDWYEVMRKDEGPEL